MHKEDLLELHETLYNVRSYLLNQPDVSPNAFSGYEEVGITPEDDNLPKKQHRYAIFVLGKEIAAQLSSSPMSEEETISNRMNELAENLGSQIEV